MRANGSRLAAEATVWEVWVAKFSWELEAGNGPLVGTVVSVDP
ncbi:MAG: hypothetical protein ABSB52_00975 [Acidimicrobiales bacterium]